MKGFWMVIWRVERRCAMGVCSLGGCLDRVFVTSLTFSGKIVIMYEGEGSLFAYWEIHSRCVEPRSCNIFSVHVCAMGHRDLFEGMSLEVRS